RMARAAAAGVGVGVAEILRLLRHNGRNIFCNIFDVGINRLPSMSIVADKEPGKPSSYLRKASARSVDIGLDMNIQQRRVAPHIDADARRLQRRSVSLPDALQCNWSCRRIDRSGIV